MRNSSVFMFCGTALLIAGAAFDAVWLTWIGGSFVAFALFVVVLVALPEPKQRRVITRRSRAA